jgi:very-short-patch-repair endonuclease
LKLDSLIGLVAVVLLVAVVSVALRRIAPQHGLPKRRPSPLTKREQAMYFRLRDSLPDFVVLGQVAMSALLTANARAVRNTFDRKVLDFVVCSKAFDVIAVIELDDASHADRATQDSRRDSLLTQAGYRVVRYANVPDADQLRADFSLDSPPATEPLSPLPV